MRGTVTAIARTRLLLLAAAATGLLVAAPAAGASSGGTVRLLFAGDVMLGRGVAPVAAADPQDLFAGVHDEVSAADLAVANLESPLTLRRHLPAAGPNALEARPASAALLAGAGFDAIAIANNHAGDAGPHTVTDTIAALARAGLAVLGAGPSAAAAYAPRIVEVDHVRIALLAFDATGQGPGAGAATPGVATWNEPLVRAAVERARREADVVTVGIQGGTEYVPATDPHVMHLAREAAAWGADVVWGQGPHVVQPVRVLHVRRDGRPTIVATSLGNFLFDQHLPGTQQGALLEVLAGAGGVRAFRIGSVRATAPMQFLGWRLPQGDAAALGGDWWSLARRPARAAPQRAPLLAGFPGTVISAVVGDAEGNGGRQLVVAFRRPFRPTNISPLVSRRELVDRRGLTAHVGLYRPGTLQPLWIAGTLLRPVAAVAACDGAIAVGYSTLDGSAIVATGAWRWGGFGFLTLPPLPGRGVAACADVDGRLDPVVLERSSR
ncbi:MAG TPA: CapA family protein [Gaiellaceae bacterium]|nr:CapA family protein [Gaiellaceae bacterium]